MEFKTKEIYLCYKTLDNLLKNVIEELSTEFKNNFPELFEDIIVLKKHRFNEISNEDKNRLEEGLRKLGIVDKDALNYFIDNLENLVMFRDNISKSYTLFVQQRFESFGNV